MSKLVDVFTWSYKHLTLTLAQWDLDRGQSADVSALTSEYGIIPCSLGKVRSRVLWAGELRYIKTIPVRNVITLKAISAFSYQNGTKYKQRPTIVLAASTQNTKNI